MKNNNQLITLQAAYLKMNTLADYLLDNYPRTTDDLIFKLNTTLNKPRSSPDSSSYNGVTAIMEGLGFLILKKYDIKLEVIYDCFSDKEIADWINFDYKFKENEESFSFRFILEIENMYKDIKKSKWLPNNGILINDEEIINGRTFCNVTIIKNDLRKYALEIIDEDPLIFIDEENVKGHLF